MGSLPTISIRAHTAKIYGIDWSRHDDSNIITCSLDKSVKVGGQLFEVTLDRKLRVSRFPLIPLWWSFESA